MEYKSTRGYSGWAQLAILLVFLGIGLIFAGLIQFYIGSKALGNSTLEIAEKGTAMMKALMKPENLNYAQTAQVFGVFFLLFFPSIAYILICHKNLFWAGFSKHFNYKQIIIAFLIISAASFFASPFADISKTFFTHYPYWNALAKTAEINYNDAIASMTGLHTSTQFIMGIFLIAFLPGLFEEFFFRGVLQNLFMRWWKKPALAIIITSILFSLVHASYYLFISRFILGCALGLLFYKSKNIWVNIFAHFINNLIALMQLFYLNNKTGIKPNINDMDTPLPVWSVFITFAILYGLFILFEKISVNNRQKIINEEGSYVSGDNPFDTYEKQLN